MENVGDDQANWTYALQTCMIVGVVDLDEFIKGAEAWLEEHAQRRGQAVSRELRWGEGSDQVGILHNHTFEEERTLVDGARAWQQLKSDAGYGSITYPVEYGGAALAKEYENAFRQLERQYATPPIHEAISISANIVAPTILTLGDNEQKRRFVESLRRTDELCCQLFSEPGAGSDLGSIATRAESDGDEWVLNGQKVWTSGAGHADWGYLIARTNPDPTVPRQRALTAFVIDMRVPGVEVRPLRQMSGGSSFNEVFFTDARVSDSLRIGEVGAGWAAAMTTLGIERASGSGGGGGPEPFDWLVLLARHLGRDVDRIVRQGLANVYIDARVRAWTSNRARVSRTTGGVPGPEGSIGKLANTNGQQRIAAVASELLGPRLLADTGEWGTYAWSEFVLGAPGMRVAGGTDEIQRNTISERALGLPREPR